jgi:3-phosphoshikimate 1-carboxyvinyltransferase
MIEDLLTVDKDISSDIAVVNPAEGLRGEIAVPGDKSISHRAIIMGSIAEGVTEVSGFLEGEDTMSTLSAFKALGVAIERPGPTKLRIRGNGMDGLNEPEDVIDAGNSGTTARLLTGLLSAQTFFSVVTGDPTLRRRPMKRVVAPLVKMGASVTGRKDGSLLPLAISGRRLKGISYSTPVASAQLKSTLLLAGLYAEGETEVIEPAKSRDHTERMLKLFGAQILVRDNSVMVRRAKRLDAARIEVPGDLSSAAFFVVGAIITPGSELLIKAVGVNPTRLGVIEILKRMGAHVDMLNPREVSGEPVADLSVRSSALRGVEITGTELLPAIDEFPVLCVAAALAEGTTVISGAKELRVKESDRVAAMAGSLKALGVNCEEREDGLVIEGSAGRPLSGNPVKSHADHRIAMSMAIAALRTDRGVRIDGAGSVQVSFPGFFSLLDGVRV